MGIQNKVIQNLKKSTILVGLIFNTATIISYQVQKENPGILNNKNVTIYFQLDSWYILFNVKEKQ